MLQEVFNNRDGKRSWHEKTFAIKPLKLREGGVFVWLGSQQRIEQLPDHLRQVKGFINEGFYAVHRGGLFTEWRDELRHRDGRSLSHVPPHKLGYQYVESRNPINWLRSMNELERLKWLSAKSCGSYWVGIAAFPLPSDWYRPDSSWSGWTHIFHGDSRDQTEDAFRFVINYVSETGNYPENMKDFTRQLARQLRINTNTKDRFDLDQLYWQLPWLNPILAQHPLSGALLT